MWMAVKRGDDRRHARGGEERLEDAVVAIRQALASLQGAEDEVGGGEADDIGLDARPRELVRRLQELDEHRAHPDERQRRGTRSLAQAVAAGQCVAAPLLELVRILG